MNAWIDLKKKKMFVETRAATETDARTDGVECTRWMRRMKRRG